MSKDKKTTRSLSLDETNINNVSEETKEENIVEQNQEVENEIDQKIIDLVEQNKLFIKKSKTGGEFYEKGIVNEFTKNPILKKAEKTVNNSTSVSPDSSFTRGAEIIEIDKDILDRSSVEDISAMQALTNNKVDEVNRFRQKHIDYGNNNALHEIISQKIFALTGMSSPDTKIMVDENKIRENGVIEISIISPMVTGYKDLGDFLIDNSLKNFISPEKIGFWESKKEEIESINNQETFNDKDKLRRIKLFSEIYEILPNYFHNEIEKSFAASKFVHNWDFANLNLNNIGCVFEKDHDNNIVSFKSVFVDFGNSGAIGFGGKYKDLSHQRANTEAKSKDKKPRDYDPAISLTKDEEKLVKFKTGNEVKRIVESCFSDVENESSLDKTFKGKLKLQAKNNLISKLDNEELDSNIKSTILSIQQNQETQEIKDLLKEEILRICQNKNPSHEEKKLQDQLRNKAINSLYLSLVEAKESEITESSNFALRNEELIRSIIFKETHHIREEEAKLNIDDKTTGLLTFSDLPRNIAFSFLFKNAIKQKNDSLVEKQDLNESFYRDSEIEMAFRLSLIPDQSIDYLIEKWDLSKEFPLIFVSKNEIENPEKYQGEELANFFKERKNTLVKSVPQEVINKWIEKNYVKAVCAEESVKSSIFEQTDSKYNIQEENSLSKKPILNFENELNFIVNEIKSEIEKKKEEIKEEIFNSDEEIKKMKEDSDKKQELINKNNNAKIMLESFQEVKNLKSVKDTIDDNIILLEIDIKGLSKNMEEKTEEALNKELVEYINKKSKEWNMKIFNSDPSYNILDFKRISKEVKSQKIGEGKIDEDIMNSSIVENFIKNLDKISDGRQNIPSLSPNANFYNKFSNTKNLGTQTNL